MRDRLSEDEARRIWRRAADQLLGTLVLPAGDNGQP
jgi:hypothetical protein